MFKKYDKTFRIIIPEIQAKGKFALSKEQAKLLLGSKVVIEEKMDGANIGIIRHKKGFHLQKRGSLVGASEHPQFQFFHNWARYQNYEKIMNLPVGCLLYGELMWAVHSIYYDKLPDWVLIFDILYKGKWLNRQERTVFCDKYGFVQVPLIAEGKFFRTDLYNFIPKKSAYGDMAEGIVIKKYKKKEYSRGKIVKPEFIKFMEESEHWDKGPIKKNILQKI